jgi:cofilin
MSTGVTASDEVVTNFTELKKQSNKTTYVVYKIEDGKIVTEFTSGEDALFSDFLTHLPADDCRYALYKMDFTTNDGRPGNKLVNIAW